MIDLKIYFFWATAIVLALLFSSLLVFSRMSMARIEKRIQDDGLPRPCPWDGPGARIFWYAWALSFPVGRANREDDPFIDVPLVKSYATKFDEVRAIAFVVAQSLFIVLLILFVALDIETL